MSPPSLTGPTHEVTLAFDAFQRYWQAETRENQITFSEPKPYAVNDRLELFQGYPRRPGVTGKRLVCRVSGFGADTATVRFTITGRFNVTTERARRRR